MRFNDVGVLVEIAIFSQKTQKTLRFLGFSFRFSLSPYYYMLGKIPMVQIDYNGTNDRRILRCF